MKKPLFYAQVKPASHQHKTHVSSTLLLRKQNSSWSKPNLKEQQDLQLSPIQPRQSSQLYTVFAGGNMEEDKYTNGIPKRFQALSIKFAGLSVTTLSLRCFNQSLGVVMELNEKSTAEKPESMRYEWVNGQIPREPSRHTCVFHPTWGSKVAE